MLKDNSVSGYLLTSPRLVFAFHLKLQRVALDCKFISIPAEEYLQNIEKPLS